MNTSAFFTMIITEVIITAATIYFFYRVLMIKPKPEQDSFSENDEEQDRH